MKNIEYFLLDTGTSWTFSKLIPYFIFVFFGGILSYILRNKKIKINWLNQVKNVVLVFIPVSIYFAFYPIYEGDIFNLGLKTKSTIALNSEKTLSIVVLPDCPFCLETIPLVKKLKARNPKIKIEYIIASRPNEIPHGIADKIPRNCTFRLESNLQKLGQVTHGALKEELLA